MDELYSNLENYNEVNVVDELRNENKELKYKLEKCSNAMNQLQTDFDKINNEYKKLEVNYSSLLKTARAEIERKTQLITNLNKEKDMLVISFMQRGNKNVLRNLTHNVKKEVYNNSKNDAVKKEGDNEFPNGNNISNHRPIVETRDVSRVEAHLQSPIDSVSSIGTTNKSTSSENNLRNTGDKHSSDSKENILKNVLDQQHKDSKAKSKKIKDRRKSMPVLSNWEKHISSDEEYDHCTNKSDLKRHRDNEDNNNSDLGYGRTHKILEQPRYGPKNKYNTEKYTDKYSPRIDCHTRSHQQISNRRSPEIDRYKSHRQNDRSSRSDYRQRTLKSPPSDKYNRSKSRDRRHRERDNQWDCDNYNKHNLRNEYNTEERAYIKEPDRKRRRLESTSTDTERYERFVDKKSFRHSEYSLSLGHDNYTSCQSPDYDQIESNIAQHFVKEIKNTATIQLEDPRITSKKYLLKKSDEGSFITAVGKNVFMQPINKSQWGIEKVELPEALKEKPSAVTLNDDLVKYIYMDMDDPNRNISTKMYRQKHSTDGASYIPIASDTPERNKLDHNEDINLTRAHHNRNSHKVHDQISKTLSSHYKIPKKSKAGIKDDILPMERANKNERHTNDKDVRNFEKTSSINSIRPLDTHINESSSNVKLKNQAQRLTPIKDNVEDDLELSDEADIMDDIHTTDTNDNKLKVNESIINDTRDNVVETCQGKDNHKNRTAKENRNKTCEQVCDEDIPKKRKECSNETLKAVYGEKNSKNVEEFQNFISDVENIDKIPEENKEYNNKILKEKTPKKIEECKKKISKNKREESTEKLNKTSEQVCDEDVPKKRKECSNETLKAVCDEKNSKTVEEFQNLISDVENIDKIHEKNEECNKKTLKQKTSIKLEECKKKISKNKREEITTEKFDECKILKTQSKDTRKREKRKKISKGDTDKTLHESELLRENLKKVTENELKGSEPKNKFTELFGESSSLITPDDLGLSAKFANTERNDNYGSLFENTQDAIDLNVREIQGIHNTEKNNSDVFLPSKVLSTEDNPQISYVIDNNSVFEIEDKHSGDKIFKNLKPAVTDNESNVVKTVVISAGIQPCVEEKEIQQKKLPEIKSNNEMECLANKPLGLLKAVATSTPNKMQCEVSSRLTEISTPYSESLSNDTISLSNTGHSITTSIDVAESNAPDVRIFLKRRRKIKKTS